MKVSIVTEHRFLRVHEGYYTRAPFDWTFWKRYLDVFDSVNVVARVAHAPTLPGGFRRADGPGVLFHELPYYKGPVGYLSVFPRLRRALNDATRHNGALILRVPSPIANIVAPGLIRRGRPFAVEVLGDPADIFARDALRHPLRPVLRRWLSARLRQQCAAATHAAYVTRRVLQRRYPCAVMTGIADPVLSMDAAQSAAYGALTSLVLRASQLPATPRLPEQRSERIVLCVGSLEHPYKGVDLLIRAVADCRARGCPVVARVVGDGRERRSLESLARKLRVESSITFTGALPSGSAVFEEIDRCDLFVLPSRAEGLPRALLEAMSRAKPCLASRVGGIPEILDDADLVSRGDWKVLAQKIVEVLADRRRLAQMAERNLERAREYTDEALQSRRVAFYSGLALRTAEWRTTSNAEN